MLEGTVEARMAEWRRLPSQARPHLTLKKVKNERDRHVLLDACEQCQGGWRDGGELEAIQRGLLNSTLSRQGAHRERAVSATWLYSEPGVQPRQHLPERHARVYVHRELRH